MLTRIPLSIFASIASQKLLAYLVTFNGNGLDR